MIFNEERDRFELIPASESDRMILMKLKQKLNKKLTLFFSLDAGQTADQAGLIMVLDEEE